MDIFYSAESSSAVKVCVDLSSCQGRLPFSIWRQIYWCHALGTKTASSLIPSISFLPKRMSRVWPALMSHRNLSPHITSSPPELWQATTNFGLFANGFVITMPGSTSRRPVWPDIDATSFGNTLMKGSKVKNIFLKN